MEPVIREAKPVAQLLSDLDKLADVANRQWITGRVVTYAAAFVWFWVIADLINFVANRPPLPLPTFGPVITVPVAIACYGAYRLYLPRIIQRSRVALARSVVASLNVPPSHSIEVQLDLQRAVLPRKKTGDDAYVDRWLTIHAALDGLELDLSATENVTVRRHSRKTTQLTRTNRVRSTSTTTTWYYPSHECRLVLRYDPARSSGLAAAGTNIWRQLSVPEGSRWGEVANADGVLTLSYVIDSSAVGSPNQCETPAVNGLASLLGQSFRAAA